MQDRPPGRRETGVVERLSQLGGTRLLEVRGLPTEVDVLGDGPAVLFLHGFPLDRSMWRPLVSTLPGWRRIAPDLRTVHASLGARAVEGMGELAEDAVALLDALGIARAVVCGLSMGGYVAFELFRRHRDRVQALVLSNTRAEAETAEGARARDELAALVRAAGPMALADRLLPRMLAPTAMETLPHVVEHVRKMIARHTVDGVVDALEAMKHRPEATPLLGGIDVPTLVVAGEQDQIVSPEVARAMAARIPGAQFNLIPGAGHLAPLEEPVATSRVVGGFLESLL
jgi:pimeloyl-ACP methyl ester carboxylesterase